jgi:carbonic anhydrase
LVSDSEEDEAMSNPCPCPACAEALHRRRFLGGGVLATALAAGWLMGGNRALAQTTLSPAEALDRMMAGNDRFVHARLSSFEEDLAALKQANTAKQEPFAAVLSCADSRVPVELVFDQSIGRLFVARVAGNIASPDMIASLEYGVAVLGVKAIMVEGCGAVKAAAAGKAVPGQISTLYAPLRPAVERSGGDVETAGKLNAQIQADLLATASPVIAGQVAAGSLKVVAAYYTLATGKVTLLA